MSVRIPEAPSAQQAREDVERLAELRLKTGTRDGAPKVGFRRAAYVGIAVLLAGNVVLGALLVSGAVNGGDQAQATDAAAVM